MSSDRAFNQSYPAEATSVPRARRALAMFAGATGGTSAQVEAVRLAASEALTNAVLHGSGAGGAGSGAIRVSASRSGEELRVRIADDGPSDDVAGQPGLGMGLALIACLADYFAMSKRGAGGTEIRMCFDGQACRENARTVDGSRARAGVRHLTRVA